MSPKDLWKTSARYAKSTEFDDLTDTGEIPVCNPTDDPDHSGRLGRPSRDLLAAGSLVNVGLAVSSIFVSLFFYISSGSITNMALFAFGRYGGLMAMSAVVAAAFPGTTPRRLFRVGVGLTALFYLSLIVLGKAATPLALPLGLFNGAASGVYWFGVNTLIYDVVEGEERGRYYGLNFAFLNITNVAGPLGAGLLIA